MKLWQRFLVLGLLLAVYIGNRIVFAGTDPAALYGLAESLDSGVRPAMELARKGNLFDALERMEACWSEPYIYRSYYGPALKSGDKLYLETALSTLKNSLSYKNINALMLAGYLCAVLETSEAEGYFSAAVKLNPEIGGLGMAFWRLNQGMPQEAAESLQNMSGAGAVSEKATYYRGMAAWLNGQYMETKKYWQNLSYHGKTTYCKDTAKLLLVLGQFKDAQQRLDQGLALTPGNVALQDLKGVFLRYGGNSNEALTLWRKMVINYPSYPFGYTNLIWEYLHMNDITSALYYYNKGEKILAIHKGNLNLMLGQRYEKKNLVELAAERYRQALIYDEKNPVAYLLLAYLHLKSQKYKDAELILNKGIEIFPGLALFYKLRSQVYNLLGDPEREKKDLAWAEQVEGSHNSAGLHLDNDPYLYSGTNGLGIILTGNTARASRGLWLSADGAEWSWFPWYGFPAKYSPPKDARQIRAYPCVYGFSDILSCGIRSSLSGKLLINNGAAETDQTNINLSVIMNQDNTSDLSVAIREYGGRWSEWMTWQPAYFWTLSSGNGSKRIEVKVKSIKGYEIILSGSIYLNEKTSDYMPPIGSLHINNGNTKTASLNVALNIQASDDESGLGEMSIANDGEDFGPWIPYKAVYSWRLTDGEGLKIVYIKFRDRAGNVSQIYYASIYYDEGKPVLVGEISIISITGNSVAIAWETSEPTKCTLVLSLPGGTEKQYKTSGYDRYHNLAIDGLMAGYTYSYRLIIADVSGRLTTTGPWQFTTAEPEPVYPSGSITINNGEKYTNVSFVRVNVAVSNTSNYIFYALSNNGAAWSPWQSTMDADIVWELDPGDGEKTVYVRFKDYAGNISAFFQDSIILDTNPPDIDNLVVTKVDPVSMRVSWTTNEEAECEFYYGQEKERLSPARRLERQERSGAVYFYEVRLTNLSAGVLYYFHIKAKDKAGNISWSSMNYFITGDTEPFTGYIEINNGADYTNSLHASLYISASGEASEMQFSTNNGMAWSAWLKYQNTYNLLLPPGDGLRTVSVRFRNRYGRISTVYSDEIIVDTVSPRIGGILAQKEGKNTYRLRWNTDEPALCRLAFKPILRFLLAGNVGRLFEWGYRTQHEALIYVEHGMKYTVVISAQDRAGNTSLSASQPIMPDHEPLPSGSITINNGAEYTKNRLVKLVMQADNATIRMQFSQDNRNWTPWERYQSVKYLELSGGDGRKTVFVRFGTRFGLISAVYSDQIVLDGTPPLIDRIYVSQTGRYDFKITWRTSEPALCRFILEPGMIMNMQQNTRNYSEVHEAAVTTKPGASYQFRIEATDQAGNKIVSPSQVLVNADTSPPTGSIVINDGAEYAMQPLLKLTLNAAANVSEMQFSFQNQLWSNWERYSKDKYLKYSGLDGMVTIYVRFKTEAGKISKPYSDSIILDTQKPGIFDIQIRKTAEQNYNIGWQTDEPCSCSISINPPAQIAGSGPTREKEQYATRHGVTVVTQPGNFYKCRIRATDHAGNTTESNTFELKSELSDNTPPSGRIMIEGGARITNQRDVILTVYAEDSESGMAAMAFSNEGKQWTTWESYRTEKKWILSTGNGEKTVYAKFKDNAGNVSAAVTATIILQQPDITPLLIDDIRIKINPHKVDISWRTNRPSYSRIEYWLAGGRPVTVDDSGLKTNFKVKLENLASGNYEFRIIARDVSGKEAVSSKMRFSVNGSQNDSGRNTDFRGRTAARIIPG
ncbi:MAG: fibronectin type III domain-containing protein [Bacillota bacterium]